MQWNPIRSVAAACLVYVLIALAVTLAVCL